MCTYTLNDASVAAYSGALTSNKVQLHAEEWPLMFTFRFTYTNISSCVSYIYVLACVF